VISGGYEFFVGLGLFVNDPVPAPYLVGNLGGRVHGEILGGLASAAAGFNIQIIGPYPGLFHGSVSLEACVLWVFCGGVDIGIGLNTTDGFYIE